MQFQNTCFTQILCIRILFVETVRNHQNNKRFPNITPRSSLLTNVLSVLIDFLLLSSTTKKAPRNIVPRRQDIYMVMLFEINCYQGGRLKNILFASPDRLFFCTKKPPKFGKFQYHNFSKFQNIVKGENCSKHLPPVQWIIHLCIINLHLFLLIGNTTTGCINYLVRQNRSFMFVLIPYRPKKRRP